MDISGELDNTTLTQLKAERFESSRNECRPRILSMRFFISF